MSFLTTLLNPVPWWGRLLAILLLAGVLFLTGLVKGLHIGDDKLEAYQQQVAIQQAQVVAKNDLILQQQKAINDDTASNYQQAVLDLNAYYADRLRHTTVAGSNLPPAPKPPSDLDAIPADALPLAAQCANTTEQLIALQAWVRQQTLLIPGQ